MSMPASWGLHGARGAVCRLTGAMRAEVIIIVYDQL